MTIAPEPIKIDLHSILEFEGKRIMLVGYYVDRDGFRDEPRFAGRFVDETGHPERSAGL